MSTTLYRKYRPATFSEIIGQKHVVRTLKNAIKKGRVAQAYLFAGPRGTGKTSIARILAKAVNCPSLKTGEPCLKCDACKVIAENRALDIIEIDAASNTGVDNIRELRETVKLPPSSLKFKVYIIDEVHMLSSGAFNALLKTLEEPPAHVIFILATTEVHKIPETILSRVQRFDFTRLTVEEIVNRLEEIAKLEKVSVEKTALEMIAAHSEGGMRNAESLLGQIIALEDKKITAKEVSLILGTVSVKATAEFAESVLSGDMPGAFSQIGSLRESGADFKIFGKDLLNYFRQLLVIRINPGLGEKMSYEISPESLTALNEQAKKSAEADVVGFITHLQQHIELFRNCPLPHLYLEVAVASFGPRNQSNSGERSQSSAERNDSSIEKEAAKEKEKSAEKKPKSLPAEEKTVQVKQNPSSADALTSEDLDLVLSRWPDVINSLKSYNHSLSSVLKISQPSHIDGNSLALWTKYPFHKDKLVETQNRLTIEEAIAKITGVNLKLKPLTADEFKEAYGELKQKKSVLQEAMDIFGGKIVKE